MTTFATVLFEGGAAVPDFSRGYYTPEWADKLYRGLARWMRSAFTLVCYTDRDYRFEEPVVQRPIKRHAADCRALLEPFADGAERTIVMGLDSIIVGPLDRLLAYDGPLGMVRDPCNEWQTCSGVMSYPPRADIWERYCETDAAGSTLGPYPSDMAFLRGFKPDILDGCGLYSYPMQVRGRPLPEDAAIVYFHGRQKPHNVHGVPWIAEHWR